MKEIKLVLQILGVTLILIVGVGLFFTKGGKTNKLVDKSSLVLGAAHSRGGEEAKVTIVEFSDFECPACQVGNRLINSISNTYGAKVRLIYRHFPLTSIHKNSLAAAMATEAAGEQGKFWEYADILFERQDVWSQTVDLKELFVNYAKEINISDIEKFKQELIDQKYRETVLKDLDLGNKSGVDATPTFFVNGEKTDIGGLKLAVEKVILKEQ